MVLITRRSAFAITSLAATGEFLSACGKRDEASEGDVSATEDLMREHGVLRRLLVVCRESAALLTSGATDFDARALASAADLFKTFGEDYHERKLEEQHIFPTVRNAGGEAAALIDALLVQHQRGREITSYIKSTCASGSVASGAVAPLAAALVSFARMYEVHAAYEDTIVFQAWKKALSPEQLRETGEQFEDIERDQFHGDGFDQAVDQVLQIEQRLGVHDLARYTARAPD